MSRTSTSINSPAQLTPDEIRVLDECDKESLIYRSLPLGILSVLATQHAMTKNLISMKAKWFKLGLSLFAGYIIGKVSYTYACRKKILSQIPDSSLGRMIRGVEENVMNTHPKSVDLNQYGDSTYRTNK